jgi:hypothetical protein
MNLALAEFSNSVSVLLGAAKRQSQVFSIHGPVDTATQHDFKRVRDNPQPRAVGRLDVNPKGRELVIELQLESDFGHGVTDLVTDVGLVDVT